jgi:tetratricopeptide (TPR) repeat protein
MAMYAANNKGAALRVLGRPKEALEWFDRALEADNSDPLPWANKARALADVGEGSQAIATLDEGLSIVTRPQQLLRSKASLLAGKSGRYAEALELLQEARALDPTDSMIAADCAEMLVLAGHYAEARALAAEVLRRDPTPSRACAMHFIVYVSHALSPDTTDRDGAFRSFVEYFAREFVGINRPPLQWTYDGLLAAVRAGPYSSERKFLIQTLIDLQEGRTQARDLSYFKEGPVEVVGPGP